MEVNFGERKILESEKRKIPQVVKETKKRKAIPWGTGVGEKGRKLS